MTSQRIPPQRPQDGNPAAPGRNYIAVARGSDLVVIRVIGNGSMLNAPALADFADEQRKANFKRFVFDLERCTGLDSTFMGVMVGMYTTARPAAESANGLAPVGKPDDAQPLSPEEAARELKNHFSTNKEQIASRNGSRLPPVARDEAQFGLISAVNVSADIKNLLSMLGVDKFVKICGSCDLTKLETTILPEKHVAATERRQLILKAHETLVEIDKRNEAQFGSFLKTLAAELAK